MTPEEEARLSTWIARPDWPQIRPLLERVLGVPMGPVEEVVARVRRTVWRDFSGG